VTFLIEPEREEILYHIFKTLAIYIWYAAHDGNEKKL